MSSIFIDSKALFPIWIKFTPILNNSGKVIGAKVLPPDAEGENVKVLMCFASGRDYDRYSKMLEEVSIINHITGDPVINARPYYILLATNFFSVWGVFATLEEAEKAEETSFIPITEEAVKHTEFSVVRALGIKWIKTVTGAKI